MTGVGNRLIRSILVVAVSAALIAAAPTDPFVLYPTAVQTVAHHAPPLLHTPWSRHFADYLIRAARQPIDFAGHYVLVTESCGAECLTVAAIDVRSGRVVELNRTICCWPTNIDEPLNYHPDSQLLIAHGQLRETGDVGPHRFLLHAGRFVRLSDR